MVVFSFLFLGVEGHVAVIVLRVLGEVAREGGVVGDVAVQVVFQHPKLEFVLLLLTAQEVAQAVVVVVEFLGPQGLCMTIVLLAMFRRALPALPLSIFISAAFYFISRYVCGRKGFFGGLLL
jgi:hypothetical protein